MPLLEAMAGDVRRESMDTALSAIERAIPDTTLAVIPGAGHVSNLERPELFDEAVRAFCRVHGAATAGS